MSCGISFLSENLVDESIITLSSGSENAQFPLLNIKNEATAVKFRSIENEVVILFDLLQTRSIDSVAIHGDTNSVLGLTSASFKISLGTDFTSSASNSITLSAENLLGHRLLDTPIVGRYVELTLTGTGAFVELSNIFIGERLDLDYMNLSIDSFRYGWRDNSITSNNQYDQLFVDKRNATKLLGGSLDYCTKSEYDQLDYMFKRHLRSLPIWMIVDKTGSAMIDGEFKLAIYGYIQDVPLWSASGGNHYSCNLRINQAG